MAPKSPAILTPTQRAQFVQIPTDLSEREIARYYTLTPEDLAIINQRRRSHNRLGFAVQLCVLRFPGRTLTELPEIPPRVLTYIAQQVNVPTSVFTNYGKRENTLYEHLEEIRQQFGFRNYEWCDMLALTRLLLPRAMESNRAFPLVEAALTYLRMNKVIAPGMTTIERLVWVILHHAERRVHRALTERLTPAQHSQLDELLQSEVPAGQQRGKTRLTWLRKPVGNPSVYQLNQLRERLNYLYGLELPPIPTQLHRNRVLQLARRCSRYQAQPLATLKEEQRYALLVTYLHELVKDYVDQSLDIFDTVMGDLLRKGERSQEQYITSHARTLNQHLHLLTDAVAALLMAKEEELDPYATVFQTVPESILHATVIAAREMARPPDFDYLDLIETKYLNKRSALLGFYRTLTFQPWWPQDPAVKALEHVLTLSAHRKRVKTVAQTVGQHTYIAPLAHISQRWRKHTLAGDTINPNFYEAAALDLLKAGLRSGDIAVADSRRYGSFESYLLPQTHWEQLYAEGKTELALTGTAEDYLAKRAQQIDEQFALVRNDLQQGKESGLKVDAEGNLHLQALSSERPEAAKALSRRLYRMLPRIDLPDLLAEVNDWTGYLDEFTHLTTGAPLVDEQSWPLQAAIMAIAMNTGLSTMAGATAFTYRQLAWAADWHLREETLSGALVRLDNFVLRHPLAAAWGDGTRSSSDGLRVPVGVEAANADPNPKYFDKGRGVTFYLHIADVGPPFGRQVISTNESEALYVIDTLCHHETEFDIREHYTDTAAATEQVFALCAFLGFRYAPRMAHVLDRQLFTIGRPADHGPLNPLIHGRVNQRLIRDQWVEKQRIAASIRHGTSPASVLMRKLASYPRQNRVAAAFTEMGKVERTLFLLEFMHDEALQRRVQTGLNKGESANGLARAILSGRRGVLYDRTLQAQLHRASCLVLVMAAITAWNTVYLQAAIQNLQQSGIAVPEDLLSHVSPTGWEHINFLGRYIFEQTSRSLGTLRPLRSQAEMIINDFDEE